MFTDDECKSMNDLSKSHDEVFRKLPPSEILSAMATYQTVYHTSMGKKIHDKLDLLCKKLDMFREEVNDLNFGIEQLVDVLIEMNADRRQEKDTQK